MVNEARNSPAVTWPERRRLQVFAFDPMSTRLSGRRLPIDVRFELLEPGPVGDLVRVVDYDGTRGVWYRPVDLDDPWILAEGGLRPAESDPRTHQQVVYAVTMSVVERFERFLGRRFRWRGDNALVLVPHAFEGRNAFFDPSRRAVLFGYFKAETRDPGPNLPGQMIFTCLSGDIIAHEVTHALVHRLRPNYSLPTNLDVLAWHEAFADLVALFHHFAFPDVVSEAVASSRGDLGEGTGLLDLAQEFGRSIGRGAALRSAIGSPATPEAFINAEEPHERGACFVAGVFDAYRQTYQRRVADLLRIATGGTGVLPPGHLHPDLVARVTAEAVKNAERYLEMVVRAFDYLPVVDVTFGDVVRAIVTADRELYPDDDAHLRATLVEALRRRGIYPSRITSLADEALVWPWRPVPLRLEHPEDPRLDLATVVHSATQDLDPWGEAGEICSDVPGAPLAAAAADAETDTEEGPRHQVHQVAPALVAWAKQNAIVLGFDPNHPVGLTGLHVTYRMAADRQPRPEIIAQFWQRRRDLEDQSLPEQHRIPMRAGTTLVASVDGHVNRIIPKPLPLSDPSVLDDLPDDIAVVGREHHAAGRERFDALLAWFARLEEEDPLTAWTVTPATSRLTFAHLHSGFGARRSS